MPLRFDATLKDMVQDYLPAYEESLGLVEFAPLRPLNVDLSTLSAATDLALGQGDPPTRIVDLNFQSGPDDDAARRVLMYNSVLHYRYGVPIHSVVVLLRPAARANALPGRLRYQGRPGRGRMDFTYEVIPLWRRSPRRYLRGGLGALPLALLCRLPKGVPQREALAGVLRQIVQRLEAEAAANDRAKILTAAYILAGLRLSQVETDRLFRGIQIMKESSTYLGILAEGERKGRTEGRAEGERKGRIETLQETLLRLGQRKFGPPSRSVRSALQRITDVTRLEQLTERLLDVTSWQELLANPGQ